jgi:glucose-1-phosphate thymidylyltransferase
MRKADPGAVLDEKQQLAADAGVKGMISIGRPFLDYVLSALADAGFTRVCLVIGPEHELVRRHYTSESPPERLSLEFATQEKPLGTADAVLAAEPFAGGKPFVMLNSDNYYPVNALRMLRDTPPPAMIAFARSALIARGNVAPDRISRFGAVETDGDGFLVHIAARNGALHDRADEEVYASMNCWLFNSAIFDACRRVPLSPRGELELTMAVQLAIDTMHMRFNVVKIAEPVLDLSSRGDIATVAERLKKIEARP